MPRESLNLPYLVLTGVVLLTLVATFLIFGPQLEQFRALQQESAELTQHLAAKQSFLQSIDQKSAALAANAAAEQELKVILPAAEELEDLLRIISKQAGAAAVLVTSVNNTTAATQSAQTVAQVLGVDPTIPVALTPHSLAIGWQGSYQQARQFIAHLENSIRFLDISTLHLTQPADQPDALDGSLTAQFYSLTPP